jgi:type II secretory pathway component PulC
MLLKLEVLRSQPRLPPSPAHWATPGLMKALAWSMVALLAAVLAWTWIAELAHRGPAAQPAPKPRKIDLALETENAASAPLFGLPMMAAPPSGPAVDVKLKGVLAGDGQRIGAIVNTGGHDRFVEVGRDIGPNLRLAAVHPGYIVVERQGLKQRVDLGRLESSAGARRSAATPTPAPAAPQPLPEDAPQTPAGPVPPAVAAPPGMAAPPANALPENPPPPAAPAPISGLAPSASWA